MPSETLALLSIAIIIFATWTPVWANDACNWFKTEAKIEQPECLTSEKGHRLACAGGLEENWTIGTSDVRTLILCEWPNRTFDPQNVLRGFPSLRTLVIAKSNLSRLISPFPRESVHIEKIQMKRIGLQELPDHAFVELSSLKSLDLRDNALKEINIKAFDDSSAYHLRLSGNPLKCAEDTAWILDSRNGSLASKIVDKEELRCSAPYDGRPLVPVVEIITALKEECQHTVCECELVYVVVGRAGKQMEGKPMAFTTVNCSHRELLEMPAFLPANTTTLHLQGNKIEDIKPLTTNSAYKSVLDLYLDNNLVDSIVLLEGSPWLDRFRLLSLRGNKLTDLPTYALENVLLQNGNAVSLYLGNNPWRCDCLFTPGFQDLLIRHPNIIKDIDDVRCSESSDDTSKKQIRDLTRTEICVSGNEEPWLHPLDVLNVVLASLILLVLGKLLYDYWCFKKTGRLPWIVAKIP